jgi:hypothetical protein
MIKMMSANSIHFREQTLARVNLLIVPRPAIFQPRTLHYRTSKAYADYHRRGFAQAAVTCAYRQSILDLNSWESAQFILPRPLIASWVGFPHRIAQT